MNAIKGSGKDFVFLVEADSMWAGMLADVLQKNGIPCACLPVHGAGLVMKTGMRERVQVFTDPEKKPRAEEIVEALFPRAKSRA